MKEVLEYVIDAWSQAGFADIAGYLSALLAALGVLSVLWKLIARLWNIRRQRKVRQDLFPFYSAHEIRRATEYYVETTCQNVAPSKENEPGKSRLFVAKEKVLPFFLNNAFKAGQDEYQFYIVLADSGMGKTTLLINLYLRYTNRFFPPAYAIKLFPLGDARTDQELEKIPVEEQRRTILLLDAFDEDMQAVADHRARLNALIQKTQDFRAVVLTCRTQFFPREEEEPGETGILKFGSDKGFREFYKLYLSPFNDHDIARYLRKRFPWYQWTQRRKARQIVDYSPNLMVRPMLLSSIGELLESQRRYTQTYTLYEELIARWIEREASRVPSAQREHHKGELYTFSREVALNIYRQRGQRQGMLVIPGDEIAGFATVHQINLDEITMKSRSLLNRNTQGFYKFSHKSILEYFLAKEALTNPDFRKELDFGGMSQAKIFFEEMIWEKLTIPFFERSAPNDEYSVKDGKPRMLTKLPAKVLPEITTLKLQAWKAEDDALLLRGLRNLQQLHLIRPVTSAQEQALQAVLPETCEIKMGVVLRREPLTVSEKDALKVFGLKKVKSWWGPLEYIQNDYEDQGDVVFDRATGLLWQKSGSDNTLTYQQAQEYVDTLNRKEFAGFHDWRLPTMPELMSLLEPEEQNEDLYISPLFDKHQRWCWSSDKRSLESAWLVGFDIGLVGWRGMGHLRYVRVVRS